jgi:hypothetical protein
MHDFFPTMRLKPNTGCDDSNCRARQAEAVNRPSTPDEEATAVEEEVVHEDNDWGKILHLHYVSLPDNILRISHGGKAWRGKETHFISIRPISECARRSLASPSFLQYQRNHE